ncbi:MAG: hypothetical protein ABJA82_12240 [Myxococcales bacterium]
MSGRGPVRRARWRWPVQRLLLPTVAAMAMGGQTAGCAGTLSESEPPSSRSPQVVGLAPVPIGPSGSAPSAPVGAPDRRAVTVVTGAEIARERDATTAAGLAPAATSTPAAVGELSSPACDARVGPRAIRRAALVRTLDAGLGAWLRGVDVEGKVDRGHFQGWLVRGIYSGDPCWSDVDVLPGDVVTRINHRPIERPEEAQAVWTALRTSSEILIELLRDGRPRSLKFLVVETAAEASRRPR